ncbi:hypothetical protein M404DRAFT_1008129 [Pisolithus tinctorius Marx 270]|uniref:Uncharacterized protein n=1 Tax=Pisolithus tinctorius Marx 270 TaxID=870435 RepID=A0A0C3IC76_PISTI|nr:hypothetical protein M404DRAFT_1008129 [Pisolithus tinctorius Marx 270]
MRSDEELGLADRQRHETGTVSSRRCLYIFSYCRIRLTLADGHMEIHVHDPRFSGTCGTAGMSGAHGNFALENVIRTSLRGGYAFQFLLWSTLKMTWHVKKCLVRSPNSRTSGGSPNYRIKKQYISVPGPSIERQGALIRDGTRRRSVLDLFRGFHPVEGDQPFQHLPPDHATSSLPFLAPFKPRVPRNEFLKDRMQLIFCA